MQRSALPAGRVQQHQLRACSSSRRPQPFTSARPSSVTVCNAAASLNGNGNGNGNGVHSNGSKAPAAAKCPSPAQTIRTLVDIVNEGTLCTIGSSGHPVGIPVTFSTDKQGHLHLHLDRTALEMANLGGSSTACSLTVQPITQPARAVAAVTLLGKVEVPVDAAATVPLHVEKCLYFGGLDQANKGQEVSGEEFASAEPDVLRKAAPELVNNWNGERAEDIYRIVSDFQGVPLTEMSYAELLWVDYLGMYIRTEVNGAEPLVVRVPFYRPVLDERDARSVITMAAQIAWERERSYTPPIPSIFADAANN
ncbi:hypothetical protein PLESTB_001122100 [Pleodorina starrii]|uniref:DUF2470 domain-containing protein n=1 Tax=Pleodorina starrii TaxID=330485 RepID=A0A9W6BQQ7_9CHLO|nr:hypothetical protein PLESTM_001359600 [Pleodorina starrii]GLC56569.1 hypothetical protein PLESTB_001122100 [Pleodorina starrii]GLC76159.1 hypothetical protein PLESTF_001744500 [Pleodorina starrii]